MNLPKIIFKATIPVQQIKIKRINSSSREINTELETKLKMVWENTLKKAKEEGARAWDSQMYRLENSEYSDNSLFLSISTIPYSIATSTTDYKKEIIALGEKYYTNGLFVSSLVKTKDNKFIFGNLSGNTINQNKIDLVGGVLSQDERQLESGNDLLEVLLTELTEEINVSRNEVSLSNVIGMIMTDKFQISIVFSTELNITSEKVKSKYELHNDNEFKELIFIDQDNLPNYLLALEGYKSKIPELLRA